MFRIELALFPPGTLSDGCVPQAQLSVIWILPRK